MKPFLISFIVLIFSLSILLAQESQPVTGSGSPGVNTTQQSTSDQNTSKDKILEPVSGQMRFYIVLTGFICISAAWVIVPLIFIKTRHVEALVELANRGQVLTVLTVTYIVLTIATLGLVGVLDSEKISTLLAAIAGYVLGNASSGSGGGKKELLPPPGPGSTPKNPTETP